MVCAFVKDTSLFRRMIYGEDVLLYRHSVLSVFFGSTAVSSTSGYRSGKYRCDVKRQGKKNVSYGLQIFGRCDIIKVAGSGRGVSLGRPCQQNSDVRAW